MTLLFNRDKSVISRHLRNIFKEKAANLLYFLIKDHPFVDGNKRIGAALFLWFLEKNEVLNYPDGTKCIADTAVW